MNTLLLILFALAVCTAARAADWSWQPAVEWRTDHQSNPRLTTQEHAASESAWLSLDGAINRATSATQISLMPHLQIRRYDGESQLNADDSALGLVGRWQHEYSQLSWNADLARTSTLTSELAETGIVDLNTRRDLRDGGLLWAWYPSTVSELDAQLGYEKVDYPGGLSVGLVGYSYQNATLSYLRQLAPETRALLAVYGGKLDAPLTLTQSRDRGVRVGITRDFSAATRLDLSVGLSGTRYDGISCFFGLFCFAVERRERSQVWEAKLRHATELGAVNFAVTRSIAPSGYGLLERRDEAVASLHRALSSRLNASVAVRELRNAANQGGLFVSSDYRYFAGDASLERRLSQSLGLSAQLGVNTARRAAPGANAQGWYTALMLRWTPQMQPVRPWLSR